MTVTANNICQELLKASNEDTSNSVNKSRTDCQQYPLVTCSVSFSKLSILSNKSRVCDDFDINLSRKILKYSIIMMKAVRINRHSV